MKMISLSLFFLVLILFGLVAGFLLIILKKPRKAWTITIMNALMFRLIPKVVFIWDVLYNDLKIETSQ